MLNDRGPNIQKKKSVLYPYKYKKNLQKTSLCLHFLEQKKKWRTMQHHRNKTN